MIILGIDPGTSIVGYSIIKKEGYDLQLIDSGAIRADGPIPHDEKISIVCDGLKRIIDIHRPDTAAIEKVFFFKNNKTVISVAEAKGALLLTAKNAGLTVYEYTPLEVKMGVTGYGRSDKKQVHFMVKNILKLASAPSLDDITDAMAIAITHANRIPNSMAKFK